MFSKSLVLSFAVVAFVSTASAQKGKKPSKKEPETKAFELKNEVDSVSYGIGVNMAQSINKEFKEANLEAIIQGMKDGVAGSNTISAEQLQQVVAFYFKRKQDAVNNERVAEAQKMLKEGMAFLEANKAKEGVVTTESGLQYIVLKDGTGKQPSATSSVTVHYHGTTPEGVIFDSSVNRGEPATFGLNQVIKGWTEGLQLMKEGAKFKFFLPQELAYGSNPPPGGVIKAYMPLIFEVELIKVND
ncbi:MAG: FKBP-type peptidyl-prolyl cis-trans isomerase [Flavobacteriales bacterium]|nr:FKBP-type peptidyl-prolyl cis-trans isomerase [Flavobacteriales bacterium]